MERAGRNRTLTPADREAADRLRRIWDERARERGLTQESAGCSGASSGTPAGFDLICHKP